MNYIAEVTLKGRVEFEAENLDEAKARMEDGFSISEFECEESEIDEVYVAPEKQHG